MKKSIRGSCVCGAVEFAIEEPFRGFQYCHCSRCRKRTGSAYIANIFVPLDQFQWKKGEEHARHFELPGAKYWRSGFCGTCGSAIPFLSGTGKSFVVPAGALDDDPGERPQRNIYFASRAQWYVHAADLETHDTYPADR